MNTAPVIAEQRVVLEHISWGVYCALADEAGQSQGRLTYDQGVLEIMSPMLSHESAKGLLGRMIDQFTLVRGIDMRSSKSTTFRRHDLQRGFEADESYYIEHAADIAGKAEVDLATDPPPDLVIEIEITRSAVDKLELLSAMGIPEVWRYDGQTLTIATLDVSGYQVVRGSHVLPGFPVSLAVELLAMRAQESETALMRRFTDSITPEP